MKFRSLHLVWAACRRPAWPAVLFCVVALISGCLSPASAELKQERHRLRDLGIVMGQYPPGPLNAITDIAGVKVGHTTLISGEGPLKPGQGPIRTGVTVVIPRDDVWHKKVPAGSFVLNGTGEMTGLAWVAESGFLEYPIALTNTLSVPRVANGVMSWMIKQYPTIGIEDDTLTPVVAECDDGRLNDIQGRHVSEQHVMTALDSATSGTVAEGTIGAGTGMVSYGFKGGIGTSSRKLSEKEGGYTVGVLVNANHGRRLELVVNGIPVGKLYDPPRQVSEAFGPGQSEGSIIVVIATDGPLDARQLTRLAKRAALGLARTGSTVRHGSGDFILAFSTANVIPHYPKDPTYDMTHLADTHLNPLFAATVEATEEAILNALTMATTVTGRDNHRIEAIDLARLKRLLSGSQ
ncbi:MAG: P1 family peptidase [Nitrospira sp.]|nr:P1 family peptidase [Nitrospira sp.]